MSAVNILLFGAGAAAAGLVILAVRKIRQDRRRPRIQPITERKPR